MSTQDPPKTKKPRAKVNKILKGLLWTFGGTLGCLVTLILALLFSQAVSRGVIMWAVDLYSDSIEGSAELDAVEGTLASRLVLRGVTLRDSVGRSLVAVEAASLGLDVGDLLAGTLDLGECTVDGVALFIPTDERGGFNDLAPPGDESETDTKTDEDSTRELPLDVNARLTVGPLHVASGVDIDEDVELLVRSTQIDLSVEGAGTSATAVLQLDADFPSQSLTVSELSLAMSWDDPAVNLDTFRVKSTWGDIDIAPSTIDIDTLAGKLGAVQVGAFAGPFEELTGLKPSDVTVLELDGSGESQQVKLSAQLSAPSLATVTTTIEGTLQPRPTLKAEVDVEAQLEQFGAGLKPGPLIVRADLSAHLEDDESVEIDASVECRNCERGAATISLNGTYHPETKEVDANAAVKLATAKLDIRAQLDKDGQHKSTLSVVASSLQDARKVLTQFAELPAFHGSANTDIDCSGKTSPFAATCDLVVAVDEGSPVRKAKLDGSVAYGDNIELALQTLELDARGGSLALLTPLNVRLARDRLNIEGLNVRVGSTAGTARIIGSGHFGTSGDNDLNAEVKGFDLEALSTVVPDVPLHGSVSADVRVQGTAIAPRISASITGKDLKYGAKPLGTLTATANYEEGLAAASVRHRGGPVETIRLSASVPVDLPLTGDPVQLQSNDSFQAKLSLAGLSIPAVLNLANATIPIAGTVGLTATLSGSPSNPVLTASLRGDSLAYDGTSLGELSLDAKTRQGRADVDASITSPLLSDLKASVSVPLDLNLAEGIAAWRPNRRHKGSIRLAALDLAKLAPWVESPSLSGTVDIEATLGGPMSRPKLSVDARTRSITVDEHEIGDADLEVGYLKSRVKVTATAEGPLVEGLGLTAEVPVDLQLDRGVARWKSQSPHTVDLHVAGLNLREAGSWATTPLDLAGRGTISAALRGRASTPQIELDFDVDDFVYGGRKVGAVELAANYQTKRAQATLTINQDAIRRIDLSAHVPVTLELAEGVARWERDARHELRLTATNLDEVFVAPFVVVPEDTGFSFSVDARLTGAMSEFDAKLAVGGDFVRQGEKIPLDVALETTATNQDLDLRIGPTKAPWLSMNAETKANIPALLQEPSSGEAPDWKTIPLKLRARSKSVDLASVGPFLPAELSKPSGSIDLSVDANGTLGSPSLDGNASISSGAITLISARQRIEDLNLGLRITNDEIDLNRFSLHSGQGKLSGTGKLQRASNGNIEGQLSLKGKDLPIHGGGLPPMELSTKIDMEADITDQGSSIAMKIRKTDLEVGMGKTDSPKAIPQHERVTYASLTEEPTVWATVDTTEAAAETKDETTESASTSAPLTFTVELAEPFRVRGPSVDMSWDGSVEAKRIDGQVHAEGAVSVSVGTISLLGNEFSIDTGTVTIPDGATITPYIDVSASTTVDDVSITAKIHGRTDSLQLELSSEPAFSQSEIFTMLVTGSTDTESADPDEVQAQAASVLAAVSSPALQAELTETLRVDRVGLTFGDSADQPILSVGKNITKKLYAETQYHFNAPANDNRAQVEVRYKFAPRWTLETFFGDAAAGGADVFWSITFNGRLGSAAKKK